MYPLSPRIRTGQLALLLALLFAGTEVAAQVVTPPGGRQVRSYVPSEELVSFPSTMPFNDFVRLVNPIFLRITGKSVVDPMDRTAAIGVNLNGVHFIDAFELVLDRSGLDFRETADYFIIKEGEAMAVGTDNAGVGEIQQVGMSGMDENLPATARTREVRIDAVIFEANINRVREAGTNWSVLFGEAGGAAGGGAAGGAAGGGAAGGANFTPPRLSVDAESFFDALDGVIQATNDQIEVAFLLKLFRWFESEGYGETIASPSVTVQSGEQGQMQAGSDVPVTVTDFSGNTITQFINTGIIINVTPTLISDPSAGENGEPIEFVHLDVRVEKSSARLFGESVAIDKNNVNTQVLLLDKEQTAIGGLYSTEESFFRKGVPILKDIPLLKYLFSYRSRVLNQKELVVVLQANVMDPVPVRAGRPYPVNIYQQERTDFRTRLDRFRPGAGRAYENIENSGDREKYGRPDNSTGAGR